MHGHVQNSNHSINFAINELDEVNQNLSIYHIIHLSSNSISPCHFSKFNPVLSSSQFGESSEFEQPDNINGDD